MRRIISFIWIIYISLFFKLISNISVHIFLPGRMKFRHLLNRCINDGRGFRRFVHKSSKPGKGVVHIPARPARPYMTPAYQSGKPRIENDIKKVLREMPK